jgi:hypothetical protein
MLCAGHPLAAQRGTSSEVRAQERIVDTLVARWRRATHEWRAFDDSVNRLRAVKDTLRIGSLRLLVEPAVRGRAEAAGRVAAARIDSLAGTGAKRLEKHWLVVHLVNDSAHDTIVVAARSQRGSGEYLTVYGVAADSTLATWIYQDAVRLLGLGIDSSLYNWLRELTPDTLSTDAWLATRLDMVSSDAQITHRCYNGDLAACKVALRLVEVPDPVMTWYDAVGRRQVVKRVAATWFYGRDNREESENCIAGADAACISVMKKYQELMDPFPPLRRRSLAAVAMQIGGRSGYERMLNATGTPAERIATVADAPLDSVLHVWLAKVHDTRRPSRDMTPGIAASAFAWMLVCGLLALRSTRWR